MDFIQQKNNMSKITIKQNTLQSRLSEVELSLVLGEKEGYVTIDCPSLDIYAYGKNLPEAMLNISQSIKMFIEEGAESLELCNWLQELGWNITNSKIEYKKDIHQEIQLQNDEQEIIYPINKIINTAKIDKKYA